MPTDPIDAAGDMYAHHHQQDVQPPMLNAEHQGLLRDVERLSVQVVANRELSETALSALAKMLDERYATSVKALDAAFVAQQTAVATSFDASEKAVAAALLAAEKAVEKANVANDKRFDSVNEFRQQLGDMQTTLISRNEAEARFNDLTRQVGEIKSTVDKGFSGTDARQTMGKEYWGYIVGAVGMIAVVITIILQVGPVPVLAH
jgi:hypothetical protein